MKRTIVFLVLCCVLILLFTSLGYGWGPGPKYCLLEHPHDELSSPSHSLQGENPDDVLFVVITNWNGRPLLLWTKISSQRIKSFSQTSTTQCTNCCAKSDAKRIR
jgi:hypothetical protein